MQKNKKLFSQRFFFKYLHWTWNDRESKCDEKNLTKNSWNNREPTIRMWQISDPMFVCVCVCFMYARICECVYSHACTLLSECLFRQSVQTERRSLQASILLWKELIAGRISSTQESMFTVFTSSLLLFATNTNNEIRWDLVNEMDRTVFIYPPVGKLVFSIT